MVDNQITLISNDTNTILRGNVMGTIDINLMQEFLSMAKRLNPMIIERDLNCEWLKNFGVYEYLLECIQSNLLANIDRNEQVIEVDSKMIIDFIRAAEYVACEQINSDYLGIEDYKQVGVYEYLLCKIKKQVG